MHEQRILLYEYWKLLAGDDDFRQAWERLCAEPTEERIEAFCSDWKLPAALAQGVRWKLRIGETDLSVFRYVLESDCAPRVPDPPIGLPPADPTRETKAQYLQRVQQHIDFERFLNSDDLPRQLQQAGLNPMPETLQMLKEQHQAWQRFTEQHPAREYAEPEDVLPIAARYYDRCVKAVQAQGGVVVAARNRQRSSEYLQRMALQLYLRVVKGCSDVDIQDELERRHTWLDTQTINDAKKWLIKLQFPPQAFSRKRGRPRKNPL